MLAIAPQAERVTAALKDLSSILRSAPLRPAPYQLTPHLEFNTNKDGVYWTVMIDGFPPSSGLTPEAAIHKAVDRVTLVIQDTIRQTDLTRAAADRTIGRLAFLKDDVLPPANPRDELPEPA